MKIVINNNGEHIPATLEVVDEVMIVSPKNEKVDISQFKDGDIITCGWNENNEGYSWTCVLRGEIEQIVDNMFIADYCNIDCNGEYSCENEDSDSATWVRYATEEEKQKLFDALAKKGKAWDAEKKAVIDLKWKPKDGEKYYYPYFNIRENDFMTQYAAWSGIYSEENGYSKGWCFKTIEECGEFCQKLNKAIMEVKP